MLLLAEALGTGRWLVRQTAPEFGAEFDLVGILLLAHQLLSLTLFVSAVVLAHLGRAGTMTHDYKGYGTSTLFAALNGTVIGRCMQRHCHQEFIRFLNRIEREVPAGKRVHVILDNYATHKHPKVRAWLGRHPRFVFHVVPTSSFWLNAVEGYFAKLSKRRLKRGVFRSIVDLQAAINRFVKETNNDPKAFVWTANPDKIIAAVRRAHQVLDSIH